VNVDVGERGRGVTDVGTLCEFPQNLPDQLVDLGRVMVLVRLAGLVKGLLVGEALAFEDVFSVEPKKRRMRP
jgi:hypothetical protein